MKTTEISKTTTEISEVAFFNGSRSFAEQWPEIQRQLDVVMNNGKFSHGRMVGELEHAVAVYTGASNAIAVNSGTDALILLLRALGIGPGDEVIVPCYTFFASASSIAHVGAKPVFVDIEPGSYCLDAASVARAITGRTKAIMPVHLFIQMAAMDDISKLAAEHGLLVVEDSAEAIGMRWNGVHAGLLGSGGVLSFFPTKTLGALGDAGMILTNDDALAQQLRYTRHHGRQGKTLGHMPGISHEAIYCGTNSKMDDIQAAVLLARLPQLDAAIQRRAEIAAYYSDRLAALPQVTTPRFVRSGDATNPVYYVYLIEAENRDGLVDHLERYGIGTEVYYPIPLHRQPCLKYLGYAKGDFPRAEAASARAVALPLYPDLTTEEADYVCANIESFYCRSVR